MKTSPATFSPKNTDYIYIVCAPVSFSVVSFVGRTRDNGHCMVTEPAGHLQEGGPKNGQISFWGGNIEQIRGPKNDQNSIWGKTGKNDAQFTVIISVTTNAVHCHQRGVYRVHLQLQKVTSKMAT